MYFTPISHRKPEMNLNSDSVGMFLISEIANGGGFCSFSFCGSLQPSTFTKRTSSYHSGLTNRSFSKLTIDGGKIPRLSHKVLLDLAKLPSSPCQGENNR
jgi:hypothetical protein